MQKTKVLLLSIGAATGYGVIHDQITVRLCVEYFTIAHPPLFESASPTVLGFFWGIAATFWVGAALGALLGLVSQSDGLPPISIGALAKRLAWLLGAMALASWSAGALGFALSCRSIVSIPGELADAIPASQHHRFMAVWFAHGASYLTGFGGAALLIFRIWKRRGRPRVIAFAPDTAVGFLRAGLVVACAVVVIWWRFGR